MSFTGGKTHNGLVGGLKKALRAGRMITTINARKERGADQVGNPSRSVPGLHPGVGGHAGVRGTDVLAPPVVVHLVDAVDQHETGFRKIVGRRHDDVPHPACRQCLVDLAADETVFPGDIALRLRPFAPQVLRLVRQVRLLGIKLALRERECQAPFLVGLDRLDEGIGDQVVGNRPHGAGKAQPVDLNRCRAE